MGSTASSSPTEPVRRPLVVTADPALLDDLLRLAAAAAVEVTVAASAEQAARDWTGAPLAVVGADLLRPFAGLAPAPHPNAVAVLGAAGAAADTSSASAEADAVRLGVRALLRLPRDEPRLTDLFADGAHVRARPCLVVGTVGGCGGAGASLLALALAVEGLRRRLRTALVDADPLGPGLDLLSGHDELGGTRWSGLAARQGRLGWTALREALPSLRGCPLVTWDPGPADDLPVPAMRSVLGAAVLGSDLVVVDLPRRADAAAREALRRCGAVLVVVPARFAAVMAAYRTVPRLRPHSAALYAVSRGAGPELPDQAVASALDLPLLGDVPVDHRLPRDLERGLLPGGRASSPLAGAAGRLLDRIADAAGAP
ncbi:septum site-determining protein Ssd [Nocardiopsis coralliicola]